MERKMFTVLIGVLLGLAVALGGFGGLAWVVLFGAGGWVVGKVVGGEVDLTDLNEYFQSKKRS